MKKSTKGFVSVICILFIVVVGIFVYRMDDNADNNKEKETTKNEEAKNAQTEVEYVDPLAQQTKIEKDLKKEVKNGYKLEEPFVVVNPYGNSPLTAMVIFTTENETAVKAVIKGKTEDNNIEVTFESGKEHILPIYGLYINDTTQVELTLDDGTTKRLEIKTENIDTLLKEAEVTTAEKSKINSDFLTFVAIMQVDGGSYSSVAYDNAGDIRWLLTGGETVRPYKIAANGHLLICTEDMIEPYYYMSGIYEMDMCGKIYNTYFMSGGMHHDFYELENGNLLVCGDREDFSTVEDYIVEIDRNTGEIVWELDLKDVFNDKDGGSINRSDHDWFHNNTIDYLPEQDLILLSGRHVDAVVAIEKSKKELKWILGDPEGWKNIDKKYFFTPVEGDDDFEWQYAQHESVFVDANNILLFDNGAGRTKVGKEDQAVSGKDVYSRAVQYKVDTDNMTIEQVWEYGKDRGGAWYSVNISGSEYLGNDNYWVTSGAVRYNTETDTYDVDYTEMGNNITRTAYMSQIAGDKLVYEIKFPGFAFRSYRRTLYPENYTFKLGAEGQYKGDLGKVQSIKNPEKLDPENAKKIDFEITALTNSYAKLNVAGNWAKTEDDAALVLVDEKGNATSFKIDKPLYDMGTGKDMFAIWITPESLESGHTYDIYLYNNGVTYATKQYINILTDTSTSKVSFGSQYALYDIAERTYSLTNSEASKINNVETSIKTDVSAPVKTAKIDKQLTTELESGAYTLGAPSVIQNPFQNTPLTAMILFNTTDEVQVRVTVKGKDSKNDITSVLDATKSHRVPVIGMYADYENEILLEVLDSAGKVTDSNTVKITTDALPDTLKNVVVADKEAEKTAIGLMMINGLKTPYLYAFDSAGDIRWYHTQKFEYYGAFPLVNGNVLVEVDDILFPNASMPNSPEFHEMDFMGRVYNIYHFPEGVHHDIMEKEPNGNLMIASNSNNGYEQDMVQEIDRKTGKVVKTLDFTKLMEGCGYIDDDDWAHINTVSYDKDTDSILISPRNLSSAIRINWTTDEIMWIISTPDMWEGTKYEDKVLKPIGEINWHYEQHTIYEIKEDLDNNPDTIHIALYDNHSISHRAQESFDNNKKSYVKIYNVNPTKMTVELMKVYEAEHSKITSNYIYESEEGRMFSVNANLRKATDNNSFGVIYEYDYETQGVLGRYLISHKFYRGYNIKLDLNTYAKEYTLNENYYKGELHAPVKIAEADVKKVKTDLTIKKEATFRMIDNVLYVKAVDHSITQIIFTGKNNTYVYNLADIKMMQSNGRDYKYQFPVPLSSLESDEYTIMMVYNDNLYNVNETVTVK